MVPPTPKKVLCCCVHIFRHSFCTLKVTLCSSKPSYLYLLPKALPALKNVRKIFLESHRAIIFHQTLCQRYSIFWFAACSFFLVGSLLTWIWKETINDEIVFCLRFDADSLSLLIFFRFGELTCKKFYY